MADGMTDTIDIPTAARELEGRSPAEILRWASQRLGNKLTFATGFGAEGCVIIDLIARNDLPIDLFTLDTGLLFPETYDLWQRLESRYGVTIRAVRPSHTVDQQADEHGARLWERDPDRCCEMRKIVPLRRALAGFDAWITGRKRYQGGVRRNLPMTESGPDGRLKINPLAGWTPEDVARYFAEHDLPVHPLEALGFRSIGCTTCTRPGGPEEDPRAGRWPGFDKTECGIHLARSRAHGQSIGQ